MARFIPEIASTDIVHDSERVVYEALRGLPTGFVVLHSFPWLRPTRDLAGEPLREGEADFVILHPERGLLVLEVKGGKPELTGRTWSRGGKELRDPFDQARKSRYALLDAIEERTRKRVHRGIFAHGDVVVFPHARFSGTLPVNSDPHILVDASSLPMLPARIEEAFTAWARSETHLTPSQFTELLDALMPKLRLMRCAGAEVSAEYHRIVQITLDQRATLLGLLENERVLVEGTAGSGKTLLSLEFALTRADCGESVLLLCYNRHLSAWLQEQAKHDPRAHRAGALLEISTFHACARRLAQRARVDFDVPSTGEQAFWDEDVPLIMEQSLEVLRARGQAEAFDAIVVDEAQDFAPDWWVTIESLSRIGQAGRLYVFLDMKQSLRGVAKLPPVPLPARFRLTTNCRNTKAIARSGAALASIDIRLLPGSPSGEAPAVRRAGTAVAEAGLVLSEVRQLFLQGIKPQQLALIGAASHAKGSLVRHAEVDGIPLVDDAVDWRRGAGVLVTTARAFKGLEADVVVVYGLSGFGALFTPTDLYVAWTRARHRLVLVCQSGEVRATVEAALLEAERSSRIAEAVNRGS
ncbi:NERD domain-containing protein/DEAD/DEAH box helicase [Stigmatella sp. ncwal1]|uniref:NERD domain-containing protein/DEAD/DEAH box helicase n=1 Tax=Stigmatella ashevillensis TaxID=2995309 RepID=A0ABT5DMM3_9BACT|nr:NERD domain-containing protein/DEAD/DEAH box helicase [Stigmatella ashevillena]MDC0714294.1 NERD domain-containing protein/DEAD/DEAH box helicase [Stigmatella ashevillena]